MTKNKMLKTQRAGQQQERLRATLAHQRHLEELAANPKKEEKKSIKRRRRYSMMKSAQNRRAKVILVINHRISEGIKDNIPKEVIQRWRNLVDVLKSRIA